MELLPTLLTYTQSKEDNEEEEKEDGPLTSLKSMLLQSCSAPPDSAPS